MHHLLLVVAASTSERYECAMYSRLQSDCTISSKLRLRFLCAQIQASRLRVTSRSPAGRQDFEASWLFSELRIEEYVSYVDSR